jgi:hypothetical protein
MAMLMVALVTEEQSNTLASHAIIPDQG